MEENTKNTAQDCGCDDPNCCPPKKKPRWKIILSLLVILAALSVVVIKVAGDKQKPVEKCTPGSSCCDTTTSKNGCDTTKGSSCCPKPKN
jgi:hypothetical protein